MVEFTVMFVDGEAARSWERHPQVRKYLDAAARRLMRGRPRTVRERDHWVEVDDDRVCPCARSPWFVLQGPPIWRDELLWCGACGLAVPNRRWDRPPDRAGWAEAYRHIYEIWLASGVYEMWAERELSDLGSDLNREGRRFARELQRQLGVPVYYELFFAEPGQHPVCVSCGRATRDIGWPTWRACRRCRLMFRHD